MIRYSDEKSIKDTLAKLNKIKCKRLNIELNEKSEDALKVDKVVTSLEI